MAQELLAEPQDVVVLHGDLHHENVLDFGERGWLAIDPKRLVGERGFDFANILCNPNREATLAPGRLARQVDVVAEAAQLDKKRLLQWIVAWSGLSAAWWMGDGNDASDTMAVADLAVGELALIELERAG
jgi:streptomycin 6-kinase